MVILRNINRVKPACQLASDVYVSAQTFKRVSPAFPPNNVTMLPKYCFNAALTTPEPSQNCFVDALHFETFSLVASYYDPDKGSPYPGYILFQINTTRVCQATITKQCLQESNGDEELCMAMLVAAAGTTGVPTKNSGYKGGSGTWSPGAAAGIAVAGERTGGFGMRVAGGRCFCCSHCRIDTVFRCCRNCCCCCQELTMCHNAFCQRSLPAGFSCAGAVTWLGVFLLVLLRRKLLRLYRGKDKHSKQQADDIEQGFRWVLSGFALRLCSQALLSGFALRLCSQALLSGFALRLWVLSGCGCSQAVCNGACMGWGLGECMEHAWGGIG
jgi:hypothetical protein